MTEAELRSQAKLWLAQGRRAALIEVIGTKGSVPRETGARMLVAAPGPEGHAATLGTVGGGHLEYKAVSKALESLAASTRFEPFEDRYPLGPSLGQCCGGLVALRTSGLSTELMTQWPIPEGLFDLLLFGGGHVGEAIIDILCRIDCRVRWIDSRDGWFAQAVSSRRALPAHISLIEGDDGESEVITASAQAFFLVMTHRHDIDLSITHAILRKGRFGWFGLIGSATKRKRFEQQLLARGIAPGLIGQMVCPIGLQGLQGKQAGVIAVSAVAQILHHAQALRAPNKLNSWCMTPQHNAVLDDPNTQAITVLKHS